VNDFLMIISAAMETRFRIREGQLISNSIFCKNHQWNFSCIWDEAMVILWYKNSRLYICMSCELLGSCLVGKT
jgi:hypothetical protein